VSHEYSDTPKIRVDSTGHRNAELSVDEKQRLEPAPDSIQHTIGIVAVAEGDSAASIHYIQDVLDAGVDPPLFPVPEASESSRQQNSNSAVKRRHPADMEPEI